MEEATSSLDVLRHFYIEVSDLEFTLQDGINALFAVHTAMENHGGAYVSGLHAVALFCRSVDQKLLELIEAVEQTHGV